MLKIEVSITIQENRQTIYELLKNIETFPKFIKNIKRIQVVKRFPHRLIVDWEVLVDGALIKWREEELFDNVSYSLNFKMLEGDYNKYEGEWKLISLLHGTKLVLSINIDWGAPGLVGFPEVKKILMRKTRKSLKSMLIAIKKKMDHTL